ncbi:hypothetical protein LTR60_001667, partial [Cryomyces antarcticus]
DELFTREVTKPEVLAQAALGLHLQELSNLQTIPVSGFTNITVDFGDGYQERAYHFAEAALDGKSESVASTIKVRQTSPGTFDISVGDVDYFNVTSTRDSASSIRSFLPHTRLDTTFVRDEDKITLFQHGKQYRLQLAVPKWAEKALGIKDVTNSVLAPMPCKVLRVDVEEGQEVKKDQALVVIESMKMETVIRSPHDGKIAKVVHKAGDLCKAGTALVEFVEPSDA